MLSITLPDGSVKAFHNPISGLDLAFSIGEGLGKAALAIKLDDKICDLDTVITHNTQAEILTLNSQDQDILPLLRHDCAHIMAQAVQELYPNTHIGFGPAIEDGFYYDFAREEPFNPDDFPIIEKRMGEIITRDLKIQREVWDRKQARAHFLGSGEKLKAEHVDTLPEDATITIYRQGNWLDLCRGPHLPSTGHLGFAFRLTRVAGSYWRGNVKGPRLQRIYGTCWRNQSELKAYIDRVAEAERRDHRRLGRSMNLFHIQEEAAGGIFWHEKGWCLYRLIENYIRQRLDKAGYIEVKTPSLIHRSLWERSGHWDKFRGHMFVLFDDQDNPLALKPMNCPAHVQIFRQTLHSYRDLPLRMAEFGSCHRFEPSGSLHGLMRVRSFIQDDAHIFCTEEQVASETQAFIKLLLSVYHDFGFDNIEIRFADRPPIRAGDDRIWDRAELALTQATDQLDCEIITNPGEGAFYGPKLEFVLKDAIGRSWQCGTLQVDFVLPDRLEAAYISADNTRCRPVMLHRAILGSLERFIGILIEHYAGQLPLWLAPIQVVVVTVGESVIDYAQKVLALLKQNKLRVVLDSRSETVSYKIREHSLAKIPALIVLGSHESRDQKVTIRYFGEKQQQILTLPDAIDILCKKASPPEIRSR